MGESIKIADKRPYAKSKIPVSQTKSPQIKRAGYSQFSSPVHHFLFLQRTLGNRTVQRLMRSGAMQAKLRTGMPGDIYEQEADRVAEQVMRMPDVSKETSSIRGRGKPLPYHIRSFFEPRSGSDFRDVRIHTDSMSAEAANAVNAREFSVGNNIVFGEKLQRGLLPRIQRTIGDGHDLRSNRFKGNVELEKAYDNETSIRRGDRGIHVTILQQALVDTGFSLPVFGVDGTFEEETENAVEAFQSSKGLTGSDVDGVVGPTTMGLLDQHFLGHAPEHAIAANPARPLSEGTRPLTSAEQTAVTSAITTEVRTPTGALPVFNRTIATNPDPYEVRIANRLNQEITGLYSSLVSSRPPRIAANMMSAADVDRLAQRAKSVTDAVYGRYQTGPAMAFGVNIFDQFVQRQATISASTTNADWAANWRVLKLLSGDDGIKQIDQEHGAVQSRAPEWSLIAGVTGFPNQPPGVLDYSANPPHVTTGIVGTRRSQLLDIHRNWPASAGAGEIYLQMYLGANNAENRDIMYDTFATIIHEYIHTLEHSNYTTYRESLLEQRGGFVLREGMTDYLAKIVWDNLVFDPALRSAIEDRFQDPVNPNSHPIPAPARYDEWINAERAVGVIGIRNAMSAFFLGQTNLIGGP